jgi:membrane-bound lytic murein transglycosylase A
VGPFRILCVLMIFFLGAGCTAGIGKPREEILPSLVLISPDKVPPLADDLDGELLEKAIERSLQYYEGSGSNETYGFGGLRITGKELRESLVAFHKILTSSDPAEVKTKRIRDTFDIYKAVGSEDGGTVFFTGYFEPLMEGSLQRTERYRHPIYRTPDDTVVVNLRKFNSKYKNERLIGRLNNGEVIPYFSRADIEEKGTLAGRNLELIWFNDPIDIFFLHIQGSGKIRLPNGSFMQVSFAQSNGRPYRSIGRYLLDKGKLTTGEISHQSIKKYLREHPEELSDIFNYNESYVFFRIVENGPIGALGLTLTPGRSIATDLDLFPKGALAFVKLRKPVFEKDGNIKSWETFSRFVLNQDTGGVIKGPGRVDLFCGTGSAAEMLAGSLKETGELYFLVKRKESSTGIPPVTNAAH